jgi:hypothetical protein
MLYVSEQYIANVPECDIVVVGFELPGALNADYLILIS